MSEESQKSQSPSEAVPVFDNQLADKVASHKKEIIGGVILVIAAALILGIVSTSQSKQEDTTWKEIFTATAIAGTDTNALEEKLNTIIIDNKGANALFYAYMIKLNKLGSGLDRDNLLMAANAAESFLESYPSHKFAPQVRVDYASVLCKLGKYDEAINQYKTVVNDGPAYLKGQSLFFLGLAQEKAGKNNQAIDTYGKVAAGKGQYLAEMVDMAAFAQASLQQKMMKQSTPENKTPAASSAKTEEVKKAEGKTDNKTEAKPKAEEAAETTK